MLGGILAHYVLVVLLGVARLHELIGPEVNNASREQAIHNFAKRCVGA